MRCRLLIGIALMLMALPMSASAFTFDGPAFDVGSWAQQFQTSYFGYAGSNGNPINVMNLRIRPLASGSSDAFASVYNYNDTIYDAAIWDNRMVFASTNAAYDPPGQAGLTIAFPGSRTADRFTIDWAECYHADDGSIAVDPGRCGSLAWNGSGWGEIAMPSDWCTGGIYYDAAPADDSPEPATWALLLATVCFGGFAKRRKRA